ncbi:MAG: hypothetical protein ABJP34_11730 [Erythrobacter sp.]
MIGGFEYALIALAIAGLLYSAAWTGRNFRRFDQIPAHYDISGNATRLAACRPTAWALPIGFSVMLAGFAALLTYLPSEYVSGDPRFAFWAILIVFPAAQGLVLWLLSRWASNQT